MALINRVDQGATALDDEVAPQQVKIAARPLINCIGPRKEDDRLVGWSRILGQIHISGHSFVAISSIERHLLFGPVFIALFAGVEDSIERCRVVAVQIPKDGKDLIGNRFYLRIVANRERNGFHCCFWRRGSRDFSRTSKAISRCAIEWRLRVMIYEHIRRFIPGASQNKTLVAAWSGARGIPTPFLGVSSHVIRAEGAHPLVTSDRRETTSTEVAEWSYVECKPRSRSVLPLMDGGETLPCKLRIGRGFVPAHPCQGILRLTFGKIPEFPCCGGLPARFISEFRDNLFPG